MKSETKPLAKTDSIERSNEKTSRRSCGYFIVIPVIFVFYIGEEISKYAISEWTQYYIKGHYFPNESFHKNYSVCENKDGSQTVSEDYKRVQQQTSHWLLYFRFGEYIPAMLAALILPGYSDAIGRRTIFFLAGFGCFSKAAIAAASIYFRQPLFWILIGYVVQGLTGGSRGFVCMCFSYVADKTVTNSQRVFAITMIETVTILTATCGGFVTGYMVESEYIGYAYTVMICVALIAVALIFAFFFLVESLSKENRTSLKPVFATVKRTFDFCFSAQFKGKRLSYILLLLCLAFSELGESNRSTMETIYFLGKPFCWDPIEIGYFSLARHASKGIVGVGLLRLIQCCAPSEAIALLSTLSNLSSYIIEALATSTLVVYMATVTGVLALLAVPMIRGIMSTMTPPDMQGSMFASVAVIETLSSLIAMATQNVVYSATVSGFVFFIMAGFCLIDCLFLVVFWCTKREPTVLYEKINE